MRAPGRERNGQMLIGNGSDGGRAIEALAAAHHGAGAPLEAANVLRRERALQRPLDIAARDALAMADDLAVAGSGEITHLMIGEIEIGRASGRGRMKDWRD